MTEAAVRAFLPPKAVEPRTFTMAEDQNRDFARVMVLDTETTVDRYQSLLFGSFRIYEYDRQAHQGLFYNPGRVSLDALETIAKYSEKRDISLMSVHEFIDNVFLPEVYELKTLCIGFNLPYDLSRLAKDFGYARRSMKGGFSFQLAERESKEHTRLVIKHIDSTKSFIRFGSPANENKRKLGFRGNFADLHTLVAALTGENHSLESACDIFHTDIRKTKAKEHGKITEDYLDYNLTDIGATYSLFKKLKTELDLFRLNIPLTRVYSSASIGKDYFKQMGIKPFLEKNFDNLISYQVLGYVTTTYIGGRSEVKIRKIPVRITLLDFTSMYPTMCILMNLWDFMTCHHVEQQVCTEEVIRFVNGITLDDFRRKDSWGRLNVMALVEADNDILPIRSKFGNKEAYNIGDCYASCKSGIKLWFTLADVVNSKIRTGKCPKILQAIRFIPVGKQEGLKPITLFGRTIDPSKDNFFKAIIEHRMLLRLQQKHSASTEERTLLDKKQKALKTIANASSYGIYMEINGVNEEANVVAYGLEQRKCHVTRIETFGKQFNPFIATFITSGARLVLGIVETILAKYNQVHAFCDTDSMAVPPEYAKVIQEFFSALNPYNFEAPLFKIDSYKDENDKEHPLENVLFYGISAKRYVLYGIDAAGKIEALKASSHGLGHLLSPFNREDDNKWHKEIWLDILKLHRGKVSTDALNEKYSRSFALSKLAISSPQIMKRFEPLNKGKPYDQQIKPFNFCIVGIGNDIDHNTGTRVKPLAPYRQNAQQCPYDTFIDYESGKEMRGLKYWKRFVDVFWQYAYHPEAKFDGDTGLLARKHVVISSVRHIGKESNNLESAEAIGVHESDYVYYDNPIKKIKAHQDVIFAAKPRDVRKYGISQRTLYDLKLAISNGKTEAIKSKTICRILSFLDHTK